MDRDNLLKWYEDIGKPALEEYDKQVERVDAVITDIELDVKKAAEATAKVKTSKAPSRLTERAKQIIQKTTSLTIGDLTRRGYEVRKDGEVVGEAVAVEPTVPTDILDVLAKFIPGFEYSTDVTTVAGTLRSHFEEEKIAAEQKDRDLQTEKNNVTEQQTAHAEALRTKESEIEAKHSRIEHLQNEVGRLKAELQSRPTAADPGGEDSLTAELAAAREQIDNQIRNIEELKNDVTDLELSNKSAINSIWDMLGFHLKNPTNPHMHHEIEKATLCRMLTASGLNDSMVPVFKYTQYAAFATELCSFTGWKLEFSYAGLLTMHYEIGRSAKSLGGHMRWLSQVIPSFENLPNVPKDQRAILVQYLEKAVSGKVQAEANLKGLDASLLHFCLLPMAQTKASSGEHLGSLLLRNVRDRHDKGSYPFGQWTMLEKVTLIMLIDASGQEMHHWADLVSYGVDCYSKIAGMRKPLHITTILEGIAPLIKDSGYKVVSVGGISVQSHKMVVLKDDLNKEYIWFRYQGRWYYSDSQFDMRFHRGSRKIEIQASGLGETHIAKDMWFELSVEQLVFLEEGDANFEQRMRTAMAAIGVVGRPQ